MHTLTEQYFTNCMCPSLLGCLPPFSLVVTDLDRSNILNAYVSGMKEELNMYGTELNVRPRLAF